MKDRIRIIQGDITQIKADAIVNAANSSLLGGGGVDGAIHRAGGPEILEACKKIRAEQGKCKTGDAVITTAGNLRARYVIHTVGPVWNEGNHMKQELLKNCYRNSLELAVRNGCKTIAFPGISTGVYGYPKKEAAQTAVSEIKDFLKNNSDMKEIILVAFDDEYFNYLNDAVRAEKS